MPLVTKGVQKVVKRGAIKSQLVVKAKKDEDGKKRNKAQQTKETELELISPTNYFVYVGNWIRDDNRI